MYVRVTPRLSATPRCPRVSRVRLVTRSSQKENARPRGSGASSGTTVEDCSIHGQDNPAKGTRAREKNACVDPPRMVEEGKYVRTYSVLGQANLFSEKQEHISSRVRARPSWVARLVASFSTGGSIKEDITKQL